MNDDDMFNAKADDGSDKPTGYVSEDGTLEVRDSVDRDGTPFHGYHETELGQHDRWLRQTPDLFEKYQTLLSRLAEIDHGREGESREEFHDRCIVKRPDWLKVETERYVYLIERLRQIASYHDDVAKHSGMGWHDDVAVTLRDVQNLLSGATPQTPDEGERRRS